MFHDRKRSKSQKNMGENENPNSSLSNGPKKTKKYPCSKKKKWDVKLNKTALKHGCYESEFVGTKRLTKRLGILAKGKISDSISRLEKTMPNGLKIQTEQDLHRILQLSNESQVNIQNDSIENPNQNSFHNDTPSDGSPSLLKPPSVGKKDFEYSLRAPDSKFSLVNNYAEAETSNSDSDLLTCKKMISYLHCFSEKVNEELYPEISNLNRAKREFLDVKSKYRASRTSLSSSNNCGSSEETFLNDSSHVLLKENFKLNPVLTQESTVANDLESLFPSSQEYSSSSLNSNDEILEESLVQHRLDSSYCGNKSKSTDTDEVNGPNMNYSEMKNFFSLRQCSPDSSCDSPVFKPEVSPVKFIPEVRPSPKLYYRQKMF